MKALARRASSALAPSGAFVFWGGVVTAARRYPSDYDWRYMTISDLVYPARNPAGHGWASAGIVLCALLWLSWAAMRARRWKAHAAGLRPAGNGALRLGCICMACCALLPQWALPLAKGHELLALMAFLSLSVAIVQLAYRAVGQNTLRRTRNSAHARMWAVLMAGASLSPIVLAACAQAYVDHVLPELPWVGLSWRARGVPPYLSFAFWEWVTCMVFSLYMALLSLPPLALEE